MIKISHAIAASAILTLLAAESAFAQVNTPSLKVITPSDGQTIYGDRIPVLVSTENFAIVDYQTTPAPITGQGHVHLWLDDTNPTRDSAVKLTADTFTYRDVAPGPHTLKAELVNNNHTSLNPPITTTVEFESAPITTPAPIQASGFDKNTALVILIIVVIVILAAWWYTREEDESPRPKKTARSKKKRK